MSTVTVAQARQRLDSIIRKGRVDLYKPIQAAEVLYHRRTDPASNIDIANPASYKNLSLRWRDEVTRRLLGKVSTSSAQYQHNIWQDNALPPDYLTVLDEQNRHSGGAVERYIYLNVEQRQQTVAGMIAGLEVAVADPQQFQLRQLLDRFVATPGIRRSIDKAYEIVVYALLETIVTNLGAQVVISVPTAASSLLAEFGDLTSLLLGLEQHTVAQPVAAHIYRVGVTNAADRGLDMWANFGPAIQVKHLTLDERLAASIVDQVESDNIIIVCQDSAAKVIETVVRQIGWGRRVRAIISQSQLEGWYERCLHGQHASQLADDLLRRLLTGFQAEFPLASQLTDFLRERGYDTLQPPSLWQVAVVSSYHQL